MTLHASMHLAALTRALQRVHGTWAINVLPASTDNATKLRFLRASGRDFLAPTPQLQAAMNAAIAARLFPLLATNPDAIDPMALYAAAGAAARDHIVGRFEHQGGDVPLAPLSPAYRAYKVRRGRDPRIGICTKALLNDLKSTSRFLVRRVG